MKRPVTRVADLLNPAAMLLPAANVIMQLSLPGVGYGVLESPVDSGNVYKHPFKRARTTGTYLAVATIGTESDRATDPRRRRHRTPAGAVDVVEPGVLQRLRPQVAALGGRLPVPLLRRPARVPARPARRRHRRRRLPRRQAAGHHAAGARAHVAAGPGRLRRVLEALARRTAHRPAGARASARGGVAGVPAVAVAGAGRTVQPVRDDGLPRPGVPGADAAGLVRVPAAPVRVAAEPRCGWPTG